MKFKLSTKREVELHDLNYSQREECENLSSVILTNDGDMEIKNSVKARTLWCLHGLGLDDKEKLNEYSTIELNEITREVMEQATKAKNPTEQES